MKKVVIKRKVSPINKYNIFFEMNVFAEFYYYYYYYYYLSSTLNFLGYK
ncbi:MAG: hypothetical protein N6V49_13640 [Serratia symbiotica]|nr:hypothetical protein [Serratia symbiotica]